MPLLTSASGNYVSGSFTMSFIVTLPERFRLGLRLGKLSKAVRPIFKALGHELEFETRTLLATAPLRHGNAPYPANDAIAKETLLWMGWLGVHRSGPLTGRLLVNAVSLGPGNSGRSSEFSASLGECLSLAVMTDILKHPLATIQRIPENAEGMDFRTNSVGGTAIEAKAGHGSCLAAKKRQIAVQMRRQKIASMKYGCVLMYERMHSPKLKRNGSSINVYDPPGVDVGADDIGDILRHYLQISQAIGFWSLTDGINAHLGLPGRESPMDVATRDRLLARLVDFKLEGAQGSVARLRSLAQLSGSGPGIAFAVGDRPYLARSFDFSKVLHWSLSAPFSPLLVLGIAFDIAQALAMYLLKPSRETSSMLERVVFEPMGCERRSFTFARTSPLGPVYYCGLEDGTVRVDLNTIMQVLNVDLNTAEAAPRSAR